MIKEIISYDEFSTLRLSRFVKARWWLPSKIHRLENWEFMGGLWIGEAVGFTEFLRLESRPEELGSVAVDFGELSLDTVKTILETLKLPLKALTTFAEVEEVLGKPENSERFTSDRLTHNYTVGGKWPYHISCTVHESKGLIYLVVMRKDLLTECNA